MVNHLLNFSGAPGYAWLLALQYACFIVNHLATECLGWHTPAEWLTGSTPDITALLFFVFFIFFQPVFYREFDRVDDENEKLGRFVGIAEHVGHALTFKVLTEDAKVVSCSLVRPATKTGIFENRKAMEKAPSIAPVRLNAKVKVGNKEVEVVIPETVTDDEEDDGESQDHDPDTEVNATITELSNKEPDPPKEFLRSAMEEVLEKGGELPTLASADILGHTFITTPDEEGEQVRAKIEGVWPHEEKTADQMDPLWKFKC